MAENHKLPEHPADEGEAPAGGSIAARSVLRFVLAANVVLLLVVACFFRIWQLGNIPGLNGDEAWYGVKALQILQSDEATQTNEFWFTPTGNPINPFFLGLQVAFHAIFPPSIFVLRTPAVLCGLLTLLLNYYFCQREYDCRTALISSGLLAVLPVSITYSRIAWDACQTMLFTVPTVYLALPAFKGQADYTRLAGAALAFLGAVIVHPTNLFLGPIIALAVWACVRADSAVRSRWRPLSLVAVSLVAAVGIAFSQSGQSQLQFGRLLNPVELVRFGLRLVNLLSGVTVFEYVAGSRAVIEFPGGFQWDVLQGLGIVVASTGVVLVGSFVRLAGSRRERLLLAALTIAIAGMIVSAGAAILRTGYERYALSLIVPIVVLIAAPLAAHSRRRGWVAVLLVGLGWLQLGSFYVLYFAHIQQTGGSSELTFRTAAVEPKSAALDVILEHSPGDEPIRIVTDRWWNYWSLRYLAMNDSRVHVIRNSEFASHQEWSRMVGADRLWIVVFEDGPLRQRITDRLKRGAIPYSEHRIADYGDKTSHRVIRIER